MALLKYTSRQTFRQCFYSGTAMIGLIIIGLVFSWSGPMQMKLQNDNESPLGRPVTDSEMSWIASLVYISAPIGPIYSGLISEKVGRKPAFIAATLMYVLGFTLLLHPMNIAMLYAGRLMIGFGSGLLPLTVTYVAEITTDDIRGSLTSALQAASVFGQLLQYSITPYLSYTAASYANLALPIIYLALIFVLPESPVFCVMKGRDKNALQALKKLRGYSAEDAEAERQTTKIKARIDSKTARGKPSDLWFHAVYLKHFLIAFALIAGQQFSGYIVLTFYMTSIFEAAGSSIDANYASLIVICVQFVVSLIVPVLVKKYKRKTVLVPSLATLTLSMICIAIYFNFLEKGHPVISTLGFLPLVLVIIFIVGYSLGLGTIPWMLVPELLPADLIAVASMVLTINQCLVGFLTTVMFSTLIDNIGPHGTFGLCAGITTVTLMIVVFVLPETKGKSVEELCEG